MAAALPARRSPRRSPRTRVTVGGGTIDVTVTGAPAVPEPMLLAWIDKSARGVTSYLGRFPVPRVRLDVRAGGRGGVGGGVTRGGRLPSIRIRVGDATDQRALDRDWVLAHEMLHLGFPDLTTDDSWAEEGLSTYAEPIARARVALVREQGIWSDLVDGLPKGLPGRGDPGLHGNGRLGTDVLGRRSLLADGGPADPRADAATARACPTRSPPSWPREATSARAGLSSGRSRRATVRSASPSSRISTASTGCARSRSISTRSGSGSASGAPAGG